MTIYSSPGQPCQLPSITVYLLYKHLSAKENQRGFKMGIFSKTSIVNVAIITRVVWQKWRSQCPSCKINIVFSFFCFIFRDELRNRSAPAVNCWVIIHCLEVSCKEDQITSAQREWFIFVQLTDKQWIITQQFTHWSWSISILTHNNTTKTHSKSSASSNFQPLHWRTPANT